LPKQLETLGGPGWITSHVRGKTISHLEEDGEWLIICTTDSHRYRVGWQDAAGNKLMGSPFLENLDVRIVVPGASITGG